MADKIFPFIRRASLVIFAGGLTLLSIYSSGKKIKSRPLTSYFSFSDSDSVRHLTDSLNLRYPMEDYQGDYFTQPYQHPLYLSDPDNIKREFELDSTMNGFNIYEKVGENFYRYPSYISYEEFTKLRREQMIQSYWKEKSGAGSVIKKGTRLALPVPGRAFETIFGSNTVEIRPTGSLVVDFGASINKTENPNVGTKKQRRLTPSFDQHIQLSVIGKIGDKLQLKTNWDTKATFDFENQLKLEYTGYEDEIIKKIEAGNVSMPLAGSLISGGQNLFGIKTQLQFGRLMVTALASQQRGKIEEATAKAGGQNTPFEIYAHNYEVNRHFFIAQYFYNNYNTALSNLPVIQVAGKITNLQVWVSDASQSTQDIRQAVAFADLGEPDPYNSFIPGSTDIYPDSSANDLFNLVPKDSLRNQSFCSNLENYVVQSGDTFKSGKGDYEYGRFRKLSSNEYTYNEDLGYISLNQELSDLQALAVAFTYVVGSNKYTVGDVTTPSKTTDVVILKLLRGKKPLVIHDMWKLMMKNIYSLGGWNINPDNFKLDIFYADKTGLGVINYLPTDKLKSDVKGKQLLYLTNLDKLDAAGNSFSDGQFDFIDRITINATTGKLVFPVTEPFGAYLESRFSDATEADKFAFDTLYKQVQEATTLRSDAKYYDYTLKGEYQASTSKDITLNSALVVQGSVKVTMGGVQLTENVDYTVDYNFGKVTIINPGILSSGQEIKVTYETNSLFGIQSRTLVGTRLDYQVNKDFVMGATFMHLNERPLTKKVNIGEEPISNTMWGFDGNYAVESRFLTKMLDKLPLLETKEMSKIIFTGEFAELNPGHPRALNTDTDPNGVSLIDDFENSKIPIDLVSVTYDWKFSSTPKRFPESDTSFNKLSYGFNRAQMCWYRADNAVFYSDNQKLIPAEELDNNHPFTRPVSVKEVFPNKDVPSTATNQPMFDVFYNPKQRGPYNYRTSNLNSNGTFNNPTSSWGGIMKPLTNTNFEEINIEFVEFWLMNPLPLGSANSGKMYINLGDINEDLLRDGEISFESGLPTDANSWESCDSTSWGKISQKTSIVNAFNNDENARKNQDVGLDGLSDSEEQSFFSDYLTNLPSGIPSIYTSDPSSDDYLHYRENEDTRIPLIERYKKYNNMDGNSPVTSGSFSKMATPIPDRESLERQGQMNTSDNYYEYEILIEPPDRLNMQVGQNFITDKFTADNGQTIWYQFKVPVAVPTSVVGNISDFLSVRFMRMYFTGFQDTAMFRFTEMQLVGGDWRKDPHSLLQPGEQLGSDDSETQLNISSVSIEENGRRTPVNYVLPCGLERVKLLDQTGEDLKQNEASLSMQVIKLQDGDARGASKNVKMDLRLYKKLKMYVHAESNEVSDGKAVAFIRMGTDDISNYYEYAVPLKMTPPGFYVDGTCEAVWPSENQMDITLSEWNILKQERNLAKSSILLPYTKNLNDGKTMTIVGNPILSDVKIIIVGVRNPKDDDKEMTLEVWFNELRVTDFKEDPGWSAIGTLKLQLADFGDITLSARHTTFGFGPIEKKINERSKEEVSGYQLQTHFEIGKFLPQTSGIKVPMYLTYSQNNSNPQYLPTDPDILMTDALKAARSKEEKDSLKNAAQTFLETRSIAFQGVRKLRTNVKRKPHFYDVENWSLNYSYGDGFSRSPTQKSVLDNLHTGGLAYNFSFNPKNIVPFKKGVLGHTKGLIPSFNYYYLPKSLLFGVTANKQYKEINLRPTLGNPNPDPIFTKDFTMVRSYGLNYDFSRSLSFSFQAKNTSRVDEPKGKIETKSQRDTVVNNLLSGGRNIIYDHSLRIGYRLPFDKSKLTNWIFLDLNSTRGFNWNAPSVEQKSFGNTIRNSNAMGMTGKLDLSKLYSRSPFLKKLMERNNSSAKKDTSMESPTESLEKIGKGFLRILLSMQNVGFSYTNTRGIVLPGYMPDMNNLGLDFNYSRPDTSVKTQGVPPGVGFILGSQKNIREKATENHWLTTRTDLATTYKTTNTKQFSAQTSLEIFKGLKVDLNFSRDESHSYSSYFRPDSNGVYLESNPQESGSFSISTITVGSAFEKDKGKSADDSKAFSEFGNSRFEIAQRLAKNNPNYSGNIINDFPDGYGKSSQDVLIPAFLQAYGWGGRQTVGLSPFKKMPLPNWNFSYDQFSNLPFFKKYFTSVRLTHSYRSVYSVGSFILNPDYKESSGYSSEYDANGNFQPKYLISQISVNENMSPFIGINTVFKNKMTAGIDFKRDRTLNFSFASSQLTEVKNKTVSFNFSYKLAARKIPIKIFKKKIYLKNDLDALVNFSIRDNKTRLRHLDDNTTPSEIQAGNKVITIEPSFNYVLNQKLNIKLFYKQDLIRPYISTQYKSSNITTGISVQYTL